MPDAVFELPVILDATTFEPVRDTLLSSSQTEATRLNGSKVERITTPGAQLIAAYLNTSKKSAIISPSPTLRAAWDDLGLTTLFPFAKE